ncbi:MAG TPA: dihydroorotase [Terriglobales bacterium]
MIDPASHINAQMDVLIEDGRIAALGKGGEINLPNCEALDARGLIVAPGFIDIHVHLREPGQQHKETIATGTAAAAAGGFTSVCAMPNTSPVNDSVEITQWMQMPERGAVVNVFPIAAATVGSKGEQLTDFRKLKEAGAVALTDDGKPVLEDAVMRAALNVARRVRLPVIQHAEDTRLTQGCSMNLGPVSFRLGLRGMPVEAESGLVERDIELVRETGAHLHVAHLSTSAALEAVRRAKREGLTVTCEVTPHHLEFTDEAVASYDSNWKMNPPLRSVGDRNALRRGLLDGSVDCVATDHAPHALHEKQVEFDRAPFGVTGLETALPVVLDHTNRDLGKTIALLSARPAQLLNLAGRGALAKGSHADIVMFDPDEEWVFTAEESKSRSKNSPFLGRRFFGRVRATIVGGRIIFRQR